MSAHVLLNLLNEMGKKIRCEALHMQIVMQKASGVISYRNDPKFSDRQVWANSADQDQNAPRWFSPTSLINSLIQEHECKNIFII